MDTPTPESQPPKRPSPGDYDFLVPCDGWFELHRGPTMQEGIVIIPIVAWACRKGSDVAVGVRAHGTDSPEGYFFIGYVSGDQIADFEEDEKSGQRRALTYKHLYQQFQIEHIASMKQQSELVQGVKGSD